MSKRQKSKKGKKMRRRNQRNVPTIELNGKKIPMGGGIPLKLVQTQPDVMTTDVLRAELEAIGLACEDITDESLEQYIADVRANIPHGKVQTFRITKPENTDFEKTETGSWDVADASEMWIWGPMLATIIQEDNFNLLQEADLVPPFCGQTESTEEHIYTPTEEAVMEAFENIATDASATLINGLDEADMEAALTNVIQAQEVELDDYYYSDSRTFYLLENYNPVTDAVDGLGAEALEWTIRVEDYREKDKDSPDNWSDIYVDCRTVLYGELFTMFRDLQYVLNQAKSHPKMRSATFPKLPSLGRGDIPMGGDGFELRVYDELPAANMATFIHSLPSVQYDGYQEATVLYLPELTNVACLDNTQSGASSEFDVTLNVGFSETTSLSFGYGASMTVGVKWLESSFEFGSEISFTDEYSVMKTETAKCMVPAGEKAFIYQGKILTKTLRWTPPSEGNEGIYEYIDKDGQFLTKVYVTSTEQQISEPATDPSP